jgi:undecaprenyl-diphosphatase
MRVCKLWPSTVMAALSAAAFVGLSVAVARQLTSGLDRRWSGRWGGAKRSTEWLAALAEPRALSAETAALALWPDLSPRDRALIAVAPALAGLAGHLLKGALPRRRPGLAGLGTNGRESFPSTHTAGMCALAVAGAYVAHRYGARWSAIGLAVGVTLATGAQRIYVRAHWPTDVIGGGLLGLAAASASRLVIGLPARYSPSESRTPR